LSVESARPGDPELEAKYLEHRSQYRGSESCESSAEEVVDQQRRCSDVHWAECVYAGSMYWTGCGVAQSAKRAEEFYGRGCAAGSMLSCGLQGWVTQDFAKAVALLEEPCRRGAPNACWNLGAQLAALGKAADVPRALKLLEAACRGDSSYCVTLGAAVRKWHVESLANPTGHLARPGS
jgi:TPR repeat protein